MNTNQNECGRLLVEHKEDFFARLKSVDGVLRFTDNASFHMDQTSVPFTQCIRRPDGIAIFARQHATEYNIRFKEGASEGSYSISAGTFQGHGSIVSTEVKQPSSFRFLYLVKVVSSVGREFLWWIGINSFSREVSNDETT